VISAAPAARRGTASPPQECFHCRLPVPPGVTFGHVSAGGWRSFCCAGCEAVAAAIESRGLDDYYRLRAAPATRPGDARDDTDPVLFDEAVVQARFVRAVGELREADLVLDGVRCPACTWLVSQTLARLPGVAAADVHFATRRARVRWDPAAAKLSTILAAIRAIGYEAWPYEEKRLAMIEALERRTALKRILVAAFGMMQVMMYAVPGYLAPDGEITPDIESLIRWASFVLTSPVMLYSAAPFFSGAGRDLAIRRLGMDVPVALGLAAAFAASVIATVHGSGPVYFDSIAMFVFLVSGGRYLELGARLRAADALTRLARLVPQVANRLVAGSGMDTERLPSALLQPADRVLVRAGESLPADGELASSEALVNEALLSGESEPVARKRGDRLAGGAVNAGSAFILRVTAVGEDSVLGKIHRLVERSAAERPRWIEAAERASAAFVAFTLAAASLAFAFWLLVEPERALWVAVSVLIVTCPCALSLATPMALTVATGAMGRRNVVIARAAAIEALAAATDVVFDKTGTLTQGRATLRDTVVLGAMPLEACSALAAAVARGSVHPLDRALVDAAPQASAADVSEIANHPGLGVEAFVAGRRVRIGRAVFVRELNRKPVPTIDQRGETIAWLGDEEGWLATFIFTDALRPEAARAAGELRAMGLRLHVLTGDTAAVGERVAADLGIDDLDARATPQRKVDYLRALQLAGARVVMVGDGINDAPVLGRSDVAIAMGSGADLAQVRADAVLLSDSLADLVRAMRLARRTRAVIRENLGWALAYNLVAIPLAVAGLVTPVVAGIGMSASSLVVAANALRLRRADP
jgi:Cu2+-exporting ATPase